MMKFIVNYRYALFIALFITIFHVHLIPIFERYVVQNFLVFEKNRRDIDIALFLFILLAWYLTFVKANKGFFLHSDTLVYSIFVVAAYTLIRIFFGSDLLDSYFIPGIKCFDVIYMVFPLTLLLWFVNARRKMPEKKSVLHNDAPIEAASQDLLHLDSRALQVCTMLKNYGDRSSIAVGIVGKWGDGKSSFMNLVAEKFKDDPEFIIVRYNSWLNISLPSIISDFFNTLELALSPYSFDLSKKIRRYGRNVLAVDKGPFSETISNIFNLMPEHSVSKDFESLNNLLSRLGKRVLIFFDDLDRLQPVEVFEVLKLIRNTASFDLFNYLVAYDKDYLIKSLTMNGIPNADKYCEKIFLKEYPLLPITQYDVVTYLRNNIAELLPDLAEKSEEFFTRLSQTFAYKPRNVLESINNLRNAKRFLYELHSSIHMVGKEVVFVDFLLVKLIKFSYYDCYELLFDKQRYVDSRPAQAFYGGNDQYNTYSLKQVAGSSTLAGIALSSNFESSVLKVDLQRKVQYSEEQFADLNNILDYLFSDTFPGGRSTPWSLNYAFNYYRYFKDELEASYFSSAQFQHLFAASSNEQRAIVNEAIEQGKIESLMSSIYKTDMLIFIRSKSAYVNFINLLFYIACLPQDKHSVGYRAVDFVYLRDVFNNYRDRIVNAIALKEKTELREIFMEVINAPAYTSETTFFFVPHFLQSLCKNQGAGDDLVAPITVEEVAQYLYQFLLGKADTVRDFDTEFWNCYNLCFIEQWSETSQKTFSSSVRLLKQNMELFKTLILPVFLDRYLCQLIVPKSDEQPGLLVLSKRKGIDAIFGSEVNMLKFLRSKRLLTKLDDHPSAFRAEFVRFLQRYLKEPEGIVFNFSYQPVNDQIARESTFPY